MVGRSCSHVVGQTPREAGMAAVGKAQNRSPRMARREPGRGGGAQSDDQRPDAHHGEVQVGRGHRGVGGEVGRGQGGAGPAVLHRPGHHAHPRNHNWSDTGGLHRRIHVHNKGALPPASRRRPRVRPERSEALGGGAALWGAERLPEVARSAVIPEEPRGAAVDGPEHEEGVELGSTAVVCWSRGVHGPRRPGSESASFEAPT
mmetsp:Transcript_583/g.1414  ORF Transcript_583/g.1414 Transcript_583/m.1414 type:complete len:203 (+) Transcript_583:19-627(+)